MQSIWKKRLDRQPSIVFEIFHAYCTGLLTHLVLVAPWYLVITHANFVELCRNSAKAMTEIVHQPGASTVLFITTAHVFARFISLLCVHSGVKTGHQPDTKQLVAALGSFKPTFLLAVPRVFEKVYNSAEQKTESEGKGRIFRAAAKVAVEHSRRVQDGEKIGLGLRV